MIDAEARVRRLLLGGRRIADPADPLGVLARRMLPESTGLSAAGVELALRECLEVDPPPFEVSALLASVRPAPRVHVVLSAGVFTSALRAIALALSASSRVLVRPSRRDPHMAELLSQAAPGLFACVAELAPEPLDHVFAYGTDRTLADLGAALPQGVVLHAHGAGIGVVIVDLEGSGAERSRALAALLAGDVVPFDQRGCLSPRVVLALGSCEEVELFAGFVRDALEHEEARVPLGRVLPDEAAAAVRYRDAARFLGQVLPAGRGLVGVDFAGAVPLVPPPGRNVHVTRLEPQDLARTLGPLARAVAAVAVAGPAALSQQIRTLMPQARESALGRMQRPPFDGPVDPRVWCPPGESPTSTRAHE